MNDKSSKNPRAGIPPNLIALANTESNGQYLRYCKEQGIEAHPARYPAELPEYFIRMLTDPGDLVLDPFAGSCVTGEVCQRTKRQWICVDNIEVYLRGAVGRFLPKGEAFREPANNGDDTQAYKVFRPGLNWNGTHGEQLSANGGKTRSKPDKHDRAKSALEKSRSGNGKKRQPDLLASSLFGVGGIGPGRPD